MKKLRLAALALISSLPLAAVADITVGDLPDNAFWYLHADLEAMRNSDGGKKLHTWFDDEVGEEVREETGIDVSAEVNSVTAFANREGGTVILVRGPISGDTRDKLLAMAAAKAPVDPREHRGETYYFFGDPDDEGRQAKSRSKTSRIQPTSASPSTAWPSSRRGRRKCRSSCRAAERSRGRRPVTVRC